MHLKEDLEVDPMSFEAVQRQKTDDDNIINVDRFPGGDVFFWSNNIIEKIGKINFSCSFGGKKLNKAYLCGYL